MVRKRRTHATKERARAVPCHLLSWARAAACVALSFLIALLPVGVQLGNSIEDGDCLSVCVGVEGLNLGRSEAYAFAPVVAGGAAALAADLGVSTTALYAGLAAMATAATGVYFFNAGANTSGSAWPTDIALPGFKPWDDLTVEEKQTWGDNGQGEQNATNEGYWQNQFDILALQMGLEISNSETGGNEPAPEPNDPEEKKKWQKARNVLAILAAGGVVSLSEVVGAVGENFVSSIFKDSTNDNATSGFGVKYTKNYDINGVDVKFLIDPVQMQSSNKLYFIYPDLWTYCYVRNGITYYGANGYKQETPRLDISLTYNEDKNGYLGSNMAAQEVWRNADGSVSSGWPSPGKYNVFNSENPMFLNGAFRGTYNIGGYSVSNGIWTTGEPPKTIEYDAIDGTPEGLVQNITNYGDLNDWANYYQAAPDGQVRAVQVPEGFTGPEGKPLWDDYVKPYEVPEVNPVPEDEPVDPEELPKPVIPTPEWNFTAELSDVVGKLNQNVFGQLFPFCLVTDMKNLAEKVIDSSGYSTNPSRGGISVQSEKGNSQGEDYRVLRIPLDDFGVAGMDEIVLDLEPILVLGNAVRPFWSVLVLVDLVAESVRIFLK